MEVTMRKAVREDIPLILSMQKKAFMPIYEKYQDSETSPVTENEEKIAMRFDQTFTTYWLIMAEGQTVGAMRVCDLGERCRISPVFVLPEYHGRGFGQQAMLLAETLYPEAAVWELDTILQEKGLCRMYERLGYIATGGTMNLRPGMDLVFYHKRIK